MLNYSIEILFYRQVFNTQFAESKAEVTIEDGITLQREVLQVWMLGRLLNSDWKLHLILGKERFELLLD